MRERKKRKKVATGETLRYYRSLFVKHLEGRELSRELAGRVTKHRNKWLRNVFRHYVQYLFYKRIISGKTYGWIMYYTSLRSYKVESKAYEISIEDLRKNLEHTRRCYKLYYTIKYFLMLYFEAKL